MPGLAAGGEATFRRQARSARIVGDLRHKIPAAGAGHNRQLRQGLAGRQTRRTAPRFRVRPQAGGTDRPDTGSGLAAGAVRMDAMIATPTASSATRIVK